VAVAVAVTVGVADGVKVGVQLHIGEAVPVAVSVAVHVGVGVGWASAGDIIAKEKTKKSTRNPREAAPIIIRIMTLLPHSYMCLNGKL